MPRVLRIINRLNLGGPTFNAAYLTKFLSPEFETLLLAGMKDDTEESSEFIVEQLGIKPVFIADMKREISPLADLKSLREIRKIIREFKPDIVHTHAAKAGTLGRIAARLENVPVIVHTFHGHVFHSYFGKVKTGIFKRIEWELSKLSTAIIAISDLQKDELCNIHHVCPPIKTYVIPLGFDLSRFRTDDGQLRKAFRNDYDLSDDNLAVSIIGRLVPVKNHPLFIRAIKQCKSQFKGKFRAFIIGDGESRPELEALCRELGLTYSTPENPVPAPDIVFTSWIHQIEYALAGCDIVAMTSLNEGTPVSLIEAQAASKPVVTTAVGGIGNVVVEGKTALLSPSGELDLFSSNLLRLLNDRNLRIELANNGWPFVKERFHYERLVEDVRQLYRKLLPEAK